MYAAAMRVDVSDGRALAVATYGDPLGFPVVSCHGGLSSAGDIAFADDAARTLGVRLLAVDRPGVGCSDPLPSRSLVGWGADVGRLADALELSRYAVVGWSFGAPYALACAATDADRVRAVTLCAPMAPLDDPAAIGQLGLASGRLLLRLAPRAPRLAAAMLRATALQPAWLLRQTTRREVRRSAPDRETLAALPASAVAGPLKAALRHTTAGTVQDYRLLARDWDVDLPRIRQPIVVWHGEQDTIVPMAHAERLVRALPTAELRRVAGAGHFLLRREAPAVLAELVAAAR
jgi:pimeloyl-ACP methyl ester carboxylesterase